MKLNSIIIILLVTGFILLVPLIAMQLSDEVNWSTDDFLWAFILIFTSLIAIELVRKSSLFQQRKTLYIILIIILMLLVWIELAVGIFNSPFSGN